MARDFAFRLNTDGLSRDSHGLGWSGLLRSALQRPTTTDQELRIAKRHVVRLNARAAAARTGLEDMFRRQIIRTRFKNAICDANRGKGLQLRVAADTFALRGRWVPRTRTSPRNGGQPEDLSTCRSWLKAQDPDGRAQPEPRGTRG